MAFRRWIGGACLALALAEIAARIGLGFGPEALRKRFPSRPERLAARSESVSRFVNESEGVVQFDAELGWTLRRSFRSGLDAVNAAGQRSDREYSRVPTPGVLRVAAFGDSFVYASGVENADAWSAVLEREHPAVEVLNYGVPAYGPDQTYLRARREASGFSPHVVVMGISCHMLACTLESVGRSREPAEFAPKPRFEVAPDGALALIPMPIRSADQARLWISDPLESYRLGRGDFGNDLFLLETPFVDRSAALRLGLGFSMWLYRRHLDPRRPYLEGPVGPICNPSSPAFEITTTLISEFTRENQGSGRQAIALLLPDDASLRRLESGAPSTCQPLLDACRESSQPCLDASEPLLAAAKRGEATFAAGHYSRKGNAVLARWLAEQLVAPAPSDRRDLSSRSSRAAETEHRSTPPAASSTESDRSESDRTRDRRGIRASLLGALGPCTARRS